MLPPRSWSAWVWWTSNEHGDRLGRLRQGHSRSRQGRGGLFLSASSIDSPPAGKTFHEAAQGLHVARRQPLSQVLQVEVVSFEPGFHDNQRSVFSRLIKPTEPRQSSWPRDVAAPQAKAADPEGYAGARRAGGDHRQGSPGAEVPLARAFVVERVKGIEPSLSAWESIRRHACRLRRRCRSVPALPLLTLVSPVNGTDQAARSGTSYFWISGSLVTRVSPSTSA